MPVEIKMPALSPTMEEGTLAKWLVKEGDEVRSGDILAEIETDKATMEFEAVDEGTITSLVIPAGTEGVKVGAVIATLAGEDEGTAAPPAAKAEAPAPPPAPAPAASEPAPAAPAVPAPSSGERIIASPLAKRIAAGRGIDLTAVTGSGPNGRIVKADVEALAGIAPAAAITAAPSIAPPAMQPQDFGIPHVAEKLSSMRRTIARRLTESKQQVPHIYLTVDVRLDALLALRGEINAALEPQGIKLSINDLLIKALAKSLEAVPECNVQFAGDQLLKFARADIAVAVSIPNGLITPIVTDAGSKSVSAISREMADLAARAREGKLAPHEYQGGTASLSNMGMYAIKQFDAVINPPQAMIMAVGAGEKRPFVIDDALAVATVMSATGSFDHRAIDGVDGARLMQAFRQLVENPLGMLA